MAHIHDRNTTYYFPAVSCLSAVSAGSLAITTPKTGSLWYLRCLAGEGGASAALRIGLPLPAGARYARGFYLRGVDLWYYAAAGLAALDLALYTSALPESGAAWQAAIACPGSYDNAHADPAGRITGGSHRLSYLLDFPFWLTTHQPPFAMLSFSLDPAGELDGIGLRLRGERRL